MVSSASQFEGYVKELLWYKEKWENNFHKAAETASTTDDYETLRTSVLKMRSVLDQCEANLCENSSAQQWDQSRKLSLPRSATDLVNGNGTHLTSTSHSSSERSSNNSPFTGFFGNCIGDGLSSQQIFQSNSFNDDYYDPMSLISDVLRDKQVGSEDIINGNSSFLSDNVSSMFPTKTTVGTPGQQTAVTQSYWPAWSPNVTSAPADMFTAFSSSPKLSYSAVAKELPSDGLIQTRKSSDSSITTAKSGPTISEAPVLMNLQKPHLAKIIYVFPLNYKIDESLLEKHFSQFGKVSKTKIFRYPNGASKTAGIIDFEDASSALSAIKKKYHLIDGCQIEAKPFEPKNHEPNHQHTTQGLVSRSSHFVNNTEFQVFVGGIPTNAVDEDIEKAITVFGKVKKIQVNPNGTFAFVSFATESDAAKIVGAHSINICGKLVECKRNQPQPARIRTNTNESLPAATTPPSTSSCQYCKKPKVKAILTCDHRVDCFECVKTQRVCPRCAGKLDISKEPAKFISAGPTS